MESTASSPTSVAMREVRGALSGLSGKLPRRVVVLPDGTLSNKLDNPGMPEVTAVSLACEALRKAAEEAVYSRHTPHLVNQCLTTNDPDAWRAFLDDATTGDMDLVSAAAFWNEGDNMFYLMQCLVNATSGMHMWLIVRVMQYLLPVLTQQAAQRLGTAFQRLFPDIVEATSRRVKDISVDMRAAAITALGRLMAWCDIPAPQLATMLEAVVNKAQDDVMRLFMFAPVHEMAAHTPTLAEKVLRRAERAQQAARYPSCSLLALMSTDQLLPFGDRILSLTQRTLDTAAAQGSMDPKLALVCGVLAKAVAQPKSLHASLAHALCCMAFPHSQGATPTV